MLLSSQATLLHHIYQSGGLWIVYILYQYDIMHNSHTIYILQLSAKYAAPQIREHLAAPPPFSKKIFLITSIKLLFYRLPQYITS